ncbi:hypothetical protein LNV08_10135 [Paucibacter sp. TC2R-5]|uniref:hypothetical protein n=1 Tax=Paucibacter sp. TC2R-5 TaxID=2893555 RepID=UPI0021E37C43|nr:hypothetical protein [Paucibacter sp. TC2R-5]MCV2359330.1 hypothetical protein [Paucibacter sp. TC2R-5]
MNLHLSSMVLVACSLLVSAAFGQQTEKKEQAGQEAAKAVDNGTDPTKFSKLAEAKYEYLDLNDGFSSGALRLSYTQPLGEKQDYSLRFRAPITRVNTLGNDRHELGDVSIQLAHVFGLTKEHGFVAQGELTFDSAQRKELGTGKNVFKGTLIYAKFLKDGSIFAPAFVQSNSFSGDKNRPKVNTTTIDFYYVPKFSDPHNLMTLDPALNFDWEHDKRFVSLAVTMGRVIGKAFGGNSIVFVKPSAFAGADRPGDWGVELGYKLIGF